MYAPFCGVRVSSWHFSDVVGSADDVRWQNRYQSPLHAFIAQDAPRPRNSNSYLAERWADVRLGFDVRSGS